MSNVVMNRAELLAPAGSLEKLRYAVLYGADAVYCGDDIFSLRAGSKNFSREDLQKGLKFAHERGRKVYVTVNIYPRQKELAVLPDYLSFLQEIEVDGVLVADLGVFMLAKKIAPRLPLHISTQTNTVNALTAGAWEGLGARRIVLARELTLTEIKEIRAQTKVELEIFVHGAMCVSYSGRCLLSNYMTHRDANRGACAQPCRWKYALTEEKRPGEFFPVEEDAHGSYILNSKDLSLLPYVPEIISAGVNSLKIEGRMKSVHYLAGVIKTYRAALDTYYAAPDKFTVREEWLDELNQVSHRPYTTGFFFDDEAENLQVYANSSYVRQAEFLGVVLNYDVESGWALIEQRNTLRLGQVIDIMQSTQADFSQTIEEMYDENNIPLEVAPHARQVVRLKMKQAVEPYAILRRKIL